MASRNRLRVERLEHEVRRTRHRHYFVIVDPGETEQEALQRLYGVSETPPDSTTFYVIFPDEPE